MDCQTWTAVEKNRGVLNKLCDLWTFGKKTSQASKHRDSCGQKSDQIGPTKLNEWGLRAMKMEEIV